MELCKTHLYLDVKLGAHTRTNPGHFKRGVSDLGEPTKGVCASSLSSESVANNAKKAEAMSVLQKALLVM